MSDVTQILAKIEDGDAAAAEHLLPLVYAELRKLAHDRIACERPDHSMQATALVHDAYLRLVNSDQVYQWNSRGHFFAAAAKSMQRILVDQARRKKRLKHGGDLQRVPLDDVEIVVEGPSFDVLALNDALIRLGETKPDVAELVKLRYFAGLTVSEAAEALEISRATADRHWTYARAWLYRELVQ